MQANLKDDDIEEGEIRDEALEPHPETHVPQPYYDHVPYDDPDIHYQLPFLYNVELWGGATDGGGGVLSGPGLSDIDKTETTHRYI